MRVLALSIAGMLMLSGCDRQKDEDAAAASQADLLNEATVNAILGAGMTVEAPETLNAAGDENEARNATASNQAKEQAE